MLESLSDNNELVYQKLSPDEMQKRGILGRLVGVCADFLRPTRNERSYSESLWEKVFSDPIMQEKIQNRVCFGELGHPTDREEIDMSKVAVCLAEVPKKGKDGYLRAVFDILPTPCGQILKQLCDYGSTLGISSRGSGDTYTDFDGRESVDSDTYNCECFDIVYLPAVKEARLKYVTESLNSKKDNKTLAEALTETVGKANDSDKLIMQEALNSLDIKLSESITPNGDDLYRGANESMEVVDNESKMISELQESLKRQQNAESQVRRLQEKLSVCYAKENSLNESLAKCRKSVEYLTNKVKKLEATIAKNESLEDSLSKKDSTIKKKDDQIKLVTENFNKSKSSISALNESLKKKDDKIARLSEKLDSVMKRDGKEISSLKEEIESLKVQVSDKKKDVKIVENMYTQKLSKSNELVEKYKSTAQKAVNKYISVQAIRYGINESDIKRKLPDNYSFADIDSVCEDMRTYKTNMSKLPFDISEGRKLKVNVKESSDPVLPVNKFDDTIDDTLVSLAGLQ